MKTYSKKAPKTLASLRKTRKSLQRIEKMIVPIEEENIRKNFYNWFEKEKKNLDSLESRIQSTFPERLYNELYSYNLKLEGHIPNLKTGYYVLNINFNNNQCKIYYGPDKELIAKLKINAEQIANYIVQHKNDLEKSYESYDNLINHLEKAYSNVTQKFDKTLDKKAPIIEVMHEIAKEKAITDTQKKPPKYGRIQFSYDLSRLLRNPSDQIRIKLSTATRAQARSRKNYLWIPKNERGDGAIYSHIEVIKE